MSSPRGSSVSADRVIDARPDFCLDSWPEAIDVSVVMPCLNEEAAITVCVSEALSAFEGLGVTGEVVVVDNGSSDGSVSAAVAAGARVVHEPIRGYGSACRRGLSEARGSILVLGDADGTYDFSAIPEFVTPLLNGADMVMGSRLEGTIDPGAMPWLHRYVGNPLLTTMLNVLYSSSVSDTLCGLRSIKKEHYESLELGSQGMEFAQEFVIEAIRKGVRIHETPITYRHRIGGAPKLRAFRDGLRHVWLMMAQLGNQSDGERNGGDGR